MFLCIGENDHHTVKVGKGDTVADAITDWYGECGGSEAECLASFHEWRPDVYEATPMNVVVKFVLEF